VKNNSEMDALILFVDAGGFTAWAERVDNFTFLDKFGVEWHKLIQTNFRDVFIKNLGDGAMIIQEIKSKVTSKSLQELLLKTLKKIKKTDADFKKLCEKFAEEQGSKIPLILGWGVAKGKIKQTVINGDTDYIGAEINKCSRYCGVARPFGIVVDATDFPKLPPMPQKLNIDLLPQKRKLKGINEDLDVWVTKEIASSFITREELTETPEVHIAGICFKKEKETYHVLLAKRKQTRKLFPGLYEGCGGQLAKNELFTSGVKRHYKLEFGIDVDVYEDCHKFYAIAEPNEPVIPGIKFVCKYISGTPKSENHDPQPSWFSENDFALMPDTDFIKDLKDDIKEFLAMFKERAEKE
jgi:class 3 adenylate cyclase/isopentenyldiphosphate isomerase